MNCPECGGAISEGRHECPLCLAKLEQREGWLTRLLHWLARPKSRRRLPRMVIEHVQTFDQQVEVVDESGGTRVYNSLADAPPDVRQRVEALMSTRGARIGRHVEFSFQDADGRERTYHSIDEMPPDVRRIYEQVHQRLQ